MPTVEAAVPEIKPVEEAPVVPDPAVIEETTAATATAGVENSLPVDYVTSTPYHEMSFDGPPASPIMESPVKPSTSKASQKVAAPVKPGPTIIHMTRKSDRTIRPLKRMIDDVIQEQVESSLRRHLSTRDLSALLRVYTSSAPRH